MADKVRRLTFSAGFAVGLVLGLILQIAWGLIK